MPPFKKETIRRKSVATNKATRVRKITRRVNGGTIGLPDRIKHFKEYYSLLS
jgi:predicted chitinase